MGMAISVDGESTEHVEMCLEHLKKRDMVWSKDVDN
jgi:hypothetical protein